MKVIYLFLFGVCLSACKTNTEGAIDNRVDVRLEAEPSQLNPILSTQGIAKQIEWQLFMPLLQYDSKSLDLYPVLAKSRPTVEALENGPYAGGRKYTFALREEASWDDGENVTAGDVVFTLKLFLHPEISFPGLRAFLSFIKKVEIDAQDPGQFSIYIDRPINLAEEVIGTMAIYPRHIFDPEGILATQAMDVFIDQEKIKEKVAMDTTLAAFAKQFKAIGLPGTKHHLAAGGPYRLKSWEPGQQIVLEKKENWWGEAIKEHHQSFKQYPDQIVYHFIAEDATLTSLLKAQEIDVATAIDPSGFDDLKANELIQKQYNFFSPLSSSYMFIAVNSKNEKLIDRKTRQAFSHLIDMDEIIQTVMNKYAVPTTGPILPNKSYYHQGLPAKRYDLGKAKDLLKKSGWIDENDDGILEKAIDGKLVDFTITYKYTNEYRIAEEVGVLLKSKAIKAGIAIDLIPLERNKLIEDTRSRDFDLYFSRWSQRPGLDDLRGVWHTANDTPKGFNKVGFGNAQTDALIDSINVELNEEKRLEMYRRIQEIIYEEQPYIFLFVPTERMLIHKSFETQASSLRPGYAANTFRLKE